MHNDLRNHSQTIVATALLFAQTSDRQCALKCSLVSSKLLTSAGEDKKHIPCVHVSRCSCAARAPAGLRCCQVPASPLRPPLTDCAAVPEAACSHVVLQQFGHSKHAQPHENSASFCWLEPADVHLQNSCVSPDMPDLLLLSCLSVGELTVLLT